MSKANDSRIRSLEGQVSAIQNTLVDLVSTLRTGMPQAALPVITPSTTYTPSLPDRQPNQPMPNTTSLFDLALQSGQNYGFPPRQSTTLDQVLHSSHPNQAYMSLPPSRAVSESPDDILAPEEIINPLGALSNMAGLVEAAVERAKEEQGSPVDLRQRPTQSGPSITENQGPKKRKRVHIHAYPDAVGEGLVSDSEGRELVKM